MIGKAKYKIIDRVKNEKALGSKIILWTCRNGERLDEAVLWCKEQGLEFDAVNENLSEFVLQYGGDCRKIFADEYWDDKAVRIE
jgi:hypothetical protein